MINSLRGIFRKFLNIIILLFIMFQLNGCINNQELSNDIQNSEVSNNLEGISIQLIETNEILSQVPINILFRDYTLISRFEERIFCYNKLSNSVDVLDENLEKVDSWRLDKNYKINNFEAVSSDTIVFSSYYNIDDLQGFRIYQLSSDYIDIVFDSNDISSFQVKTIKELTKVKDSIYMIDKSNMLSKIVDGKLEGIDTDGLALDIVVDKSNYYILSENNISVYDLNDNLENIYELNELTALELIKGSDNRFYIVCMGKLLITEDFEIFHELAYDDHRFNYTYENSVCLNSKSILAVENDEIMQFNIYNQDELKSTKKIVTVGINTLDTSLPEALRKIKSNEFDLQIVYYDDLSTCEYETKLSAELISGDAPDLIITQGSDPILDYVNNDALYDLKLLIDNDSDFDLDLYEQTLINASVINNRLYTFPLDYFPSFICINKRLMEQLNLTFEDVSSMENIYETYKMINDNLEEPDYFIGISDESFDDYLSYVYPITFSGDINSFIDFDNGKVRFDSDEFLNVLPKMKTIYQAYSKSPLSFNKMIAEKDSHNNNSDLERHLLYIHNIQNGYQYTEVYDHGEYKLPMVNGFDSKEIYNDNFFGSYVSINKDADDIETSWIALKAIISYDMEWNYSYPGRHGGEMGYSNFGISKKSNTEKADNYLDYLYSDDYQKHLLLAKDNKLLRRNDINTDILPDEKVKIFDNILRSDKKTVFKSRFDRIIIDELRKYFDGELSANELSIMLQNKGELYLGE